MDWMAPSASDTESRLRMFNQLYRRDAPPMDVIYGSSSGVHHHLSHPHNDIVKIGEKPRIYGLRIVECACIP